MYYKSIALGDPIQEVLFITTEIPSKGLRPTFLSIIPKAYLTLTGYGKYAQQFRMYSSVCIVCLVLSELQRQAEKVLKDDSNVDDETVFSEVSYVLEN